MAVPGYVLKNKRTTLERAQKFISRQEWTDCNLFSRLYKKKSGVKKIVHYAAPGRIPYLEAINGLHKQGKEASVGQSFGPTWSTHWFEITVEIPADFKNDEVRFKWDSGSEAMIWIDGAPLQGFTNENRRTDYILPKALVNKDNFNIYIEMSCNRTSGAGSASLISPPPKDKTFTLSSVQIGILDADVYMLIRDLEILVDFVEHSSEESHRGYQALYTANDMVNTIKFDDRSTYKKAMEIAQKFYSEKNGQAQHNIIAVGNCHIDTAWLWPYAETIRKCARSFSSSIRLLEKYPNYTFACSQAQQFEWVKIHYPKLYEEMKTHIKGGRFIPVGSVWVEMDGLMPGGEAMIRQFLYGQMFFEKEFGIRCREFWLPDTFGYSGQIPQIIKHMGISRFLTQKLSWSLVNKFPHHTFWWTGIDGSSVLSHFPPADSYTNLATVKELLYSSKNFRDKGRSNTSVFLYGYGDGGQGPTAEMIERLQKLEDVDGFPKVKLSTPDAFFTDVEHHDADLLCRWSGELYLELHNATYTSQAKTKKGNRNSEILLHNIEAIASVANVTKADFKYPSDELLRLWKLVLLNQFHDVLPGTSINEVYKDVHAYYKDVSKSGKKMFQNVCESLVESSDGKDNIVLFNTHSWNRTEVISLPSDSNIKSPAKKKHKSGSAEPLIQTCDFEGNSVVLTAVPSYGYRVLSTINDVIPATVEKGKDGYVYMRNEYLEAVLDNCGRIIGLFKPGCDKNAIKEDQFGNQLVIFDDIPLYWDAWDVMDYHLETRKPLEELIQHALIVDEGPLRATVQVTLKISDESYLKQHIILDSGCPYLKFKTEVHWHESRKFLKVEFPVNVLSQQATYEIQFGHLQRPTHFNTSWDWAKFEVCGHKWADVSEYNWGISVMNDCKYGWSCIDNVLRLSLLRSPKNPDEKADMGVHTFTYAVMPHTGTFQDAGVIQAAYALNNPLQVLHLNLSDTLSDDQSYFSVDSAAVILENVKKAEKEDKGIVLRLYEAYGGRTTAEVKVNLPVKQAFLCNGLEDVDTEDGQLQLKDGAFSLEFRPFQIRSVMLYF